MASAPPPTGRPMTAPPPGSRPLNAPPPAQPLAQKPAAPAMTAPPAQVAPQAPPQAFGGDAASQSAPPVQMTAAPVAQPQAAPADAGQPAAQTAAPKTRKPRKQSTLTDYWKTIEWARDANGNTIAATEIKDGKYVTKRVKLDEVPALVSGPEDAHGYDPAKHNPLKPKNFKKLGDYYRFKSSLLQRQLADAQQKAKEADEGKLRQRAAGGLTSKQTLEAMLETLRQSMTEDQIKVVMAKFEEQQAKIKAAKAAEAAQTATQPQQPPQA